MKARPDPSPLSSTPRGGAFTFWGPFLAWGVFSLLHLLTQDPIFTLIWLPAILRAWWVVRR